MHVGTGRDGPRRTWRAAIGTSTEWTDGHLDRWTYGQGKPLNVHKFSGWRRE